MVALTSDPNPADITHLWFFYHQLKIQFWLIFICSPFKYTESNVPWPISHLKWVSSCNTWRAVALHITKPGTLWSPTVRRLSGHAGQPEVGSCAPVSQSWEYLGWQWRDTGTFSQVEPDLLSQAQCCCWSQQSSICRQQRQGGHCSQLQKQGEVDIIQNKSCHFFQVWLGYRIVGKHYCIIY